MSDDNLENGFFEARHERDFRITQLRANQRWILIKSVLVGLVSGLLMGLLVASAMISYANYQPALRTILLSIIAVMLFGIYLGFVYGSHATDKVWMRIATSEFALRNGRNW